jgi:hypothetical protein
MYKMYLENPVVYHLFNAKMMINRHRIMLLILLALTSAWLYHIKAFFGLKIIMALIVIVFLMWFISYPMYFLLYKIANNGSWQGDYYSMDKGMSNSLYDFFKDKSYTIVDLGCGNGVYLERLAAETNNKVICVEGNHSVNNPKLNFKHMDLTSVIDMPSDWKLSFEVGEHIPKQFESVFLSNLTKDTKEGVILSWGQPGQGGPGHINEMSISELKKKMRVLGFEEQPEWSQFFRHNTLYPWFRNNILVYTRVH